MLEVEKYISLGLLAQKMGLSESLLKRYAKNGTIPALKTTNRLKFKFSAVQRALNKMENVKPCDQIKAIDCSFLAEAKKRADLAAKTSFNLAMPSDDTLRDAEVEIINRGLVSLTVFGVEPTNDPVFGVKVKLLITIDKGEKERLEIEMIADDAGRIAAELIKTVQEWKRSQDKQKTATAGEQP